MNETPELSSPSTTTPEATEPDGIVTLGGKVVATKAKWTMQRKHDFIDARAFGDENKTYLVGLRDVSGSFSGKLEHGDLFVPLEQEQELHLWAQARPAWWGRLKHWILGTPWPEYIVSAGVVRGEREPTIRDDEVSWSFGYVGPVTIYEPPMSWLELKWHWICWHIRHPLR